MSPSVAVVVVNAVVVVDDGLLILIVFRFPVPDGAGGVSVVGLSSFGEKFANFFLSLFLFSFMPKSWSEEEPSGSGAASPESSKDSAVK